jgi:lysozyme family protein
MLISFDEIIEVTLHHEGGYVHDPKDLGGETNFGIAKRFYPDVDIKNLTEEDAKEIYKQDYWVKNRVEELPENLRHIFFDMCVNQGRGTAVRILQRVCNAKGANLAIDGGMGPGTMDAINTYKPSMERVRCYRLKHYYDLVNKKPEQERFLFGWFKRAISI